MDRTEWGHPSVVAAEPQTEQKRTSRRLLGILLLVALIGSGLGISAYRIRGKFAGSTLPEGYAAATGAEFVHDHPTTLVRERDGIRFILIEGGPFKMGNDGFDSTGSGADEDQPAHPVILTDFSLQETEVTNGEMEAYFIANQVDVAERPKRWAKAVEGIRKAGHNPAEFPAIGITHELAEKYAKWVGGHLPTEAQWEYAARSRGKPTPYVGGVDAKPDLTNANVDSLGQHGSIPDLPATRIYQGPNRAGNL